MITLFERKDCRPLTKGETYENKFVFLTQEKIQEYKPEFQSGLYQLFYATSGFGCDPTSLGNAVFGSDVSEHFRVERYEIMGVATEEAIQLWEKEFGHSREEILKMEKGDKS